MDTPTTPKRTFPTIIFNRRNPRASLPAIWDAMVAANDNPEYPVFFHRKNGHVSALIKENGFIHDGCHRKDASFFYPIARWKKEFKNGKTCNAIPTKKLARILLREEADPRLPEIERATDIPIVLNGRLIHEPGFHPEEKAFYYPYHGLQGMTHNTNPTPDDVKAAREYLLNELLGELNTDNASVLAALFLPMVRSLIDGPTPLHMFSIESGGWEVPEMVAAIINGERVAISVPATKEAINNYAAWKLSFEYQVLLFEKCQGEVHPYMSEALVQKSCSAQMGKEYREGVNNAVWLLSNRDADIPDDLWLQLLPIRSYPNRGPRPDTRWVLENRRSIFQALMTLVQNWINQGMPADEDIPFPRFESWSEIIGGLLISSGIDGFLEFLGDFHDLPEIEPTTVGP